MILVLIGILVPVRVGRLIVILIRSLVLILVAILMLIWIRGLILTLVWILVRILARVLILTLAGVPILALVEVRLTIRGVIATMVIWTHVIKLALVPKLAQASTDIFAEGRYVLVVSGSEVIASRIVL